MSTHELPPPDRPWSSERRGADVRRLLAAARTVVGAEVSWVSRFDGPQQHFSHVLADVGRGPVEGSVAGLADSYCARVLDGRLPAVIADVCAIPQAHALPITAELGIGSYAGAPLTAPDGTVVGMLCCTSSTASPGLGRQQQRGLALLAEVASALLHSDDEADHERAALRERVLRAIDGSTRTHLLQPIVDLHTGQAVGVEALARFTQPPVRPDLWFAQAEQVGLRLPLELAAARSGLSSLAVRGGYVSVNVSPDLLLTGVLDELLHEVDPTRVVLEITEHAQVEDYALLERVLEPHRAVGLRIAVDDAGAGYASFRHILELHPEFIKVDLSLVRDIHLDPVRQALTSSLVTFARTAGAELIAEGVEIQDELDTVARLGVTLVQGYLLGRPAADPAPRGYPGPSRHVIIDASADLSVLLADAVARAETVEELARPLLDAVLRLTGLETSYLTVVRADGQLEHRFVRNTGSIELPEGSVVPWPAALCSSMQDKQLLWTADAASDLADRPLAAHFGVTTYLSSPLLAPDGTLLGTVCAGSSAPRYLSETALNQVQLVGQVLATALHGADDGGQPSPLGTRLHRGQQDPSAHVGRRQAARKNSRRLLATLSTPAAPRQREDPTTHERHARQG